MSNELGDLLERIGAQYKSLIQSDSDRYHLVTFFEVVPFLGFEKGIKKLRTLHEIAEEFRTKFPGFRAISPLRPELCKTGETFDSSKFFESAEYAQLSSGLIVPEEIAMNSGLYFEMYNSPPKIIVEFSSHLWG